MENKEYDNTIATAKTATKILICDDSTLVRKKLKDILVEMHCEVFEAPNGSEGVEQYKTHHPDTVFMDIIMPEMDGLTSLQKIREYDKNARIIMLSSAGTSSKLIEALKWGAADFIQKPYTKEQIAKAIKSQKI